ncbi:MAG: hypothetical protein ACJ72S_02555 [Nitrososphaeraceae archaeon]
MSDNEQEGEKEEHDANNILTKEIDSWNNFEYAAIYVCFDIFLFMFCNVSNPKRFIFQPLKQLFTCIFFLLLL